MSVIQVLNIIDRPKRCAKTSWMCIQFASDINFTAISEHEDIISASMDFSLLVVQVSELEYRIILLNFIDKRFSTALFTLSSSRWVPMDIGVATKHISSNRLNDRQSFAFVITFFVELFFSKPMLRSSI